jgi:hypothetical protein
VIGVERRLVAIRKYFERHSADMPRATYFSANAILFGPQANRISSLTRQFRSCRNRHGFALVEGDKDTAMLHAMDMVTARLHGRCLANVPNRVDNPLRRNGSNFAIFSERTLILLANLSDFDSAIRRFESSRPSQPSQLIALEFFVSRFLSPDSF